MSGQAGAHRLEASLEGIKNQPNSSSVATPSLVENIEKGFLASSVKAMDGRAVALMLPHVIRLNGYVGYSLNAPLCSILERWKTGSK